MALLKDQVVVVTGADGVIGEAIAMEVATQGANVVLGGQADAGLAEKIEKDYGVKALFVKGDVSKLSDAQALMAAAMDKFGHIDGLVNAAQKKAVGTLNDTDEALMLDMLSGNFFPMLYAVKAALPHMAKVKKGAIVNIGSIEAMVGREDLMAYSCAMAASLNLSKHLSRHYCYDMIRTNWITLGNVAGVDDDETLPFIPLKTKTTPKEVGEAVVFFLKDEARYITGSELDLSGGMGYDGRTTSMKMLKKFMAMGKDRIEIDG